MVKPKSRKEIKIQLLQERTILRKNLKNYRVVAHKNKKPVYQRIKHKKEIQKQKVIAPKVSQEVTQTTYVNFYIAKTNDYVRGYVVTSKRVPIEYIKELIIETLRSRHPRMIVSRFEIAYESGYINYSHFVLFREDEEIDTINLSL